MCEDKREKVLFCNHCGNRTSMKAHLELKWDDTYYAQSFYSGQYEELEEKIYHRIFVCPSCGGITLVKSIYREEFEEAMGPGQDSEMDEILFPSTGNELHGVPQNIKDAFQASLQCKFHDHAICMLALRRTLEMICKEKGYNDSTLQNKISQMTHDGILPQTLQAASDVIRNLGNAAAHADEAAFTKTQVSDAIYFIEQVINYLYIIPHKISRITAH